MSAATASIADVSRTGRNHSGQSHTQCSPMTLPALGTQKIIQGNGTSVGTVISLQCPAKHKLVGRDLTCVMDINSTYWKGETYCRPLAPYEDLGFRVAVLASIVSSAIILLMSVGFITCCLLDCIKEDEKKKQEGESEMWQWEEQAHRQEENRSHYSNKGRNNNNNNTQMNMLSLWDARHPAMCDNAQACRCHQECTHGLAALPGRVYDQPLLARYSGPCPPQYPGPPLSPCPTTPSPGLVQMSVAGPGLLWQYGRQPSSQSGVNMLTAEDYNSRSLNPAKESSIRIISV